MNFSDLSIVVQGPVIEGITAQCLKKLREIAPNAQIILSTWEGSCIEDLEFDDVVLSPDPGANFNCYTENPDGLSKPNNHNRQLVSVNAGLALANRIYTLKFRTDFILTSRFMFDFYDRASAALNDFENEFRIFDQRILVFGTGNPHTMKLAYHLADYVHLGYTRDIKKLWNSKLSSDHELNYFNQKNIARAPNYFNFKLCNEQSIWINSLQRHGINLIYPEHYYDLNDDIIFDSERSLINNFIFIDYYACDISSKFHWMADIDNDFGYRFSDYIKLYAIYFGLNRKQKKFNLWYKIKLNIKNRSVLRRKMKFLVLVKLFKNLAYFILRFIIKNIHSLFSTSRKSHTLLDKDVSNPDDNEISHDMGNEIFWINEKGDKVKVSSIPGFEIRFGGNSNTVYINSRGLMFGNTIYIDGSNNNLFIDRNVHCISHSNFFIGNSYNNRHLHIGKNAMLMGARFFLEEDDNYIKIGNNLTCSDEVLIQSSDGHIIISEFGSINAATKGIDIGDNVWLGRRSTILKGVTISSGSILAACAVATKVYEESNVIIAGNPARVIRSNINWSRDMFNQINVLSV